MITIDLSINYEVARANSNDTSRITEPIAVASQRVGAIREAMPSAAADCSAGPTGPSSSSQPTSRNRERMTDSRAASGRATERRHRVLIADDDESVIQVLQRVVERESLGEVHSTSDSRRVLPLFFDIQ